MVNASFRSSQIDLLRVIDRACTVLSGLRRIMLLVVEDREKSFSFWHNTCHAPPEVASSAPTAFPRVIVDHRKSVSESRTPEVGDSGLYVWIRRS